MQNKPLCDILVCPLVEEHKTKSDQVKEVYQLIIIEMISPNTVFFLNLIKWFSPLASHRALHTLSKFVNLI